MLNLTHIMRPYFHSSAVCKKIGSGEVMNTQLGILLDLLEKAADTEYGRKFGFGNIGSYELFAANVPLVEYPDIRADVMRMVDGQADILWPGVTRRFAQSSGTSDGKSKYIPITKEGLKGNHYRGAGTVIARYLENYPDSRIFAGKGFILGGSFANALQLKPGVKVGDLSAHLIEDIPEAINLFRIPSKKTALIADWNKKLPLLVKESTAADVTNISGVPSWFLTVLKEALKSTGKKSIHEIWPDLEVFFHGGISFKPYRAEYNSILDPEKMHYVETYNASEGFFAVQDTKDPDKGMELLLDCGIFYEFIPLDDSGFNGTPVPAWEVEQGKTYALVITSANGLWRYQIGDTVKIESLDPIRISIAGRTKSFINAFGEELMVYNADEAITKAAAETDAAIENYTAAPVYAENKSKGRHQWIIEFTKAPEDIDLFADRLDYHLQQVNSDYQAKRSGGIFLDRPEIIVAPKGTFTSYMAATGKLGGQRKMPRLSNDRKIADNILEIIKTIS